MSFILKQGDTSPSLSASLTNAVGSPLDLRGATVRLFAADAAGQLALNKLMTITDAIGGVCRYDWVDGDTDVAGTYRVEFKITYTDEAVETVPNSGFVTLIINKGIN
jgi:5-hydroxyisourate hydrolase-like protein (transthyretin family)